MRLAHAWRGRLERRWPEIVVAAAPLILFWRILFTGRVLFWGLPLLQFYPWRWLAAEQLRTGSLPLWNPYLGNGAPLLANYQTAFFYPANWLGYLPGMPLDYSLGLVGVLHIVWTGLGMVALTRTLGLNRLAQTVAALAFSLSGYFIGRFTFLTIVAAAAWLPWLLWAAENLAQRHASGPSVPAARTRLDFLEPLRPAAGWLLGLSGLFTLQLLSGHAQTTFYCILLTGGWLLVRGYQRQGRVRGSLVLLTLLGASLAAAFCLAAIQLLPTAELLRQSSRAASAEYEFVMTYSFWPWRLITLVAPDTFGNPGHGNYWGYATYWEDAAYIGVLPLGLALLAVIEWARTIRKKEEGRSSDCNLQFANCNLHSLAPFLLFILVVSLVLALGSNTPVFPFFYRYVPTFNLFQAPARMLIGYTMAVSLLAGFGAQVWTAPVRGWLFWSRMAIAGCAGVAIAAGLSSYAIAGLGSAGGSGQTARVLQTVPRAFTLAAVLAAAAFALSLTRRSKPGSVWQGAVAGLVSLDLIVAGYALNPAVDPALYRAPTASGEALRQYLEGHRLYHFETDDYDLKYKRFFRFDTLGSSGVEAWQAVREAQLPNLGLLEGIPSANNFEPLLPTRYVNLTDALQTAQPGQAWGLLRAMDVQAVGSIEPVAGMDQIFAGDGFGFYGVPQPARRIRIAYFIRATRDQEESLEALAQVDFDPDTLAVIEGVDIAASYQPAYGLCRASLFNSLARRYRATGFGTVIVSGASVCQYYTDAMLRAFNRSFVTAQEVAGSSGLTSSILSQEDILGPFEALNSPPPGIPILLTESPTHIRIAAPMEFSGYLTLADTYYPGWKAYVDGEPAPIVPANYAFRGVFVPAGQHIVEFRYQPASFRLGALLSAAALLAFIVLAGLRLRGMLADARAAQG